MKSEKESAIGLALGRLEWISKLSKKALPADTAPIPEDVRKLLNRIVQDVRGACKELRRGLSERPDESDKSNRSDLSDRRRTKPGLIPPHGGYRTLKSFQVSEIVYDGTRIFCDRFIGRRDRTHDQMVQGARSGRQNIAEGSVASGTSKKTEIKLTNVAKASLEELLLDYEDFLRQRGLRQWNKDDPEALEVRDRYKEFPLEWFKLSDLSDPSDKSDSSDQRPLLDPYSIATASPIVAANTLLCLINQATYLIRRQVERLERDFVEEGGFTERLYRVRTERRRKQ